MIVARTRVSDMSSVTKLNCWGAELSDISIVRKLKNVQVLSLSVNNIHSLSDIQYCSNLKELYIRKNKIQELSDICWLRGLSSLTNLWLEENPCCASGSYSEQYYRHTVIKALPQLRKLDNVEITPGEMVEAVSVGLELIPPHDRENNGYSSYNGSCNNSKSSPNTNEDNRYYEEDRRQINGYGDSRSHQRMRSSSIEQQQQNSVSPSRRLSNQGYDESISPQISRMRVKHPPEIHQESRSIVSQHYDQTYHQVNQQIESAQQIISQRQPTPERPYPRRPKNRNSNILSAVLCLIKELDGPSLEVAEMAVRCRMEELED
ncbi:CFAP410 [Lepeophtheirus salmonis]|uniref:CFAP410 n=2 Tax=Lepeophtheirus salmonis TaxID=72036 RepID=A0A7R8CBQ3_LEPSM|nr:CFAP410 [Lepeophtheirus salmonis]CAF2763161.1 CFAP410 [Lepeophtheirus salmonis]